MSEIGIKKICLETSVIIGFLNDEPDCEAVDTLMALAEGGILKLYISDFAWAEQYKPLNESSEQKKEAF